MEESNNNTRALNTMTRDYTRLLKTNWQVEDIESYYGIAKVTAIDIKKSVESKYGCIERDVHNYAKKSVKRDDVIKFMGGKDALTEAQIYNYIVMKGA